VPTSFQPDAGADAGKGDADEEGVNEVTERLVARGCSGRGGAERFRDGPSGGNLSGSDEVVRRYRKEAVEFWAGELREEGAISIGQKVEGGYEEVCREGREDGRTGSTHLQLGRDIKPAKQLFTATHKY
jgi:hypothetical protein